jgi:hypothetical protein
MSIWENVLMSYSIVFSGEIKASFTKDKVINNLAALFKKDISYIEKLFSGKKVIIKRDLELEHANKYLLALEKTGAVCEILNQSPGRSNTVSTDAATGTLTMADAGATIMEQTNAEEPDIDTSALSMSAAGETIMEAVPVKPVMINDLSCDISPSGSVLSDEQPVKPVNIDTSNLSLSEVGSNPGKKHD